MIELEGRRSPRIVRILRVFIGTEVPDLEAHTRVINSHGALVMSPVAWDEETRIVLRNPKTGQAVLCRVVWKGDEDPPRSGMFKVGVEFLEPSGDFWGDDYRPPPGTASGA